MFIEKLRPYINKNFLYIIKKVKQKSKMTTNYKLDAPVDLEMAQGEPVILPPTGQALVAPVAPAVQ